MSLLNLRWMYVSYVTQSESQVIVESTKSNKPK